MLSFDSLWWALLPPALYFGIHLVEGETLTPMLLARRFTINPVLVILSLVFWFWMWGVPGAILAVPMLAIMKIVSDPLTARPAQPALPVWHIGSDGGFLPASEDASGQHTSRGESDQSR